MTTWSRLEDIQCLLNGSPRSPGLNDLIPTSAKRDVLSIVWDLSLNIPGMIVARIWVLPLMWAEM